MSRYRQAERAFGRVMADNLGPTNRRRRVLRRRFREIASAGALEQRTRRPPNVTRPPLRAARLVWRLNRKQG